MASDAKTLTDTAIEAPVGALLEQLLRQALDPQELLIQDDSHLHAGHAGAAGGGHFSVSVRSVKFVGLSRVQRHRLVYHAVFPLMQGRIHALAIDAHAPGDPG
jgi:BolA protein